MPISERIRLPERYRHWLLAPVLLLMLVGDLIVTDGFDIPRKWWVLPGAVLLCLCTLAVVRYPVLAGIGAAVVLAGWSAVLRVVDVLVLTANGALLAVEISALSILVIVLARRAAGPTTAKTLTLVLIGCTAANFLRPQFGFYPADPWWQDYVENFLVLMAATSVGLFLRQRDHERTLRLESTVAAARQRERLGMARELHDVIAHHVGGMVVQAQAAQELAYRNPAATAQVLPRIENSGRDALDAMRQLVAALRESDPDGATTLPQTRNLVEDLRIVTAGPDDRGPQVRLSVVLRQQLPAPVAASVLRIVQESMTNARRHARDASEIVVSVYAAGDLVHLQVTDNGHGGGKSSAGGGYGLVGMRERVYLLGGHFSAGPIEDGGWRVDAQVPLRL